MGDLILLSMLMPGQAGSVLQMGEVWAQDAVGCGDTLSWSRSTARAVRQMRHSITEGAVREMRHMFAALAAGAGIFNKAWGIVVSH